MSGKETRVRSVDYETTAAHKRTKKGLDLILGLWQMKSGSSEIKWKQRKNAAAKTSTKKNSHIYAKKKKGNPHFYHQESLPSAKPSAVSNTRKKVKNICVETKTNERKAITSTTNRPNNRLTPLSVSQTHLSFLLHTYLHLVPTLTHTPSQLGGITTRRYISNRRYGWVCCWPQIWWSVASRKKWKMRRTSDV